MAHLLEAFDEPAPRPTTAVQLGLSPGYDTNGELECTTSRPLSGPGSSRQTRRLQLRNAGFRGPDLQLRKMTPQTMPVGTDSSVDDVGSRSDIENSHQPGNITTRPRRRSSGILKEIETSTLRRTNKSRQRRQSSKHLTRLSADHDNGATDTSLSPSSPRPTYRPRGLKTRARAPHRRRSSSSEANRYIEHLEAELAEAQAQLTSMQAANNTAERSSRLRTIAAEAKQLQEEVEAWEEMYDERVQQEVDKHNTIESSLREQIQTMEQEAEELKSRVHELENDAEKATESLQAVEAANVLLEKRVEMMSELLAASKVDLYAGTPARDRRHSRLKSLLPRFPTARSQLSSPERQPGTQPPSPRLQYSGAMSPSIDAQIYNGSSSETSPVAPQSTSELISDAESVFSEALTTGDSMTSAEHFDGISSLNAWGIPVSHPPKTRPVRRMRKFGAGSVGPKPLILPSTNQSSNYAPASAPPIERRETSPIFFPMAVRSAIEADHTPARRRSSTTATALTMANLAASPFRSFSPLSNIRCEWKEVERPASADSRASTRRHFSLTSPVGRSLMEELSALHTRESSGSIERVVEIPEDSNDGSADQHDPPMSPASQSQQDMYLMERVAQTSPVEIRDTQLDTSDRDHHSFILHEQSLDESNIAKTMLVEHSNTTSLMTTSAETKTEVDDLGPAADKQQPWRPQRGIFERLRTLFGDLWRSPVVIARHLVQTAQARMRIPEPLRGVQWWLVGMLLGPMAKRRMLARSTHCIRPPDEGTDPMETLDHTLHPDASGRPPDGGESTSAHLKSDKSGTPKARQRKRPLHRPPCPFHAHGGNHQRGLEESKHSPWLWIKFSLTLAFAIGTAFKDGPGSLLPPAAMCGCQTRRFGEGGRKMIMA